MPLFRYKAVAPGGAVSVGELDAANEGEILDRLRDQGLMPMQVAPAQAGAVAAPARGEARAPRRSLFAKKRFSGEQLMAFTRELATLLRAGLPLDRALETLIGLTSTPYAATFLQGIRDEVRGGKAMSQALDARREVFNRFYVNIVRAGEAGGALATVLTRLADTMERNKDLRETVKSALIYPIILIGVAVSSVMILLIYVVPQFQQTFTQAGKALPLPTEVVIFVGTFVKKWWWAVIAVVALAVYAFRRKLAQAKFRGRFDARMLKLPLLGDLVSKIEVARFSRTLATLLGNGVTLLSAL